MVARTARDTKRCRISTMVILCCRSDAGGLTRLNLLILRCDEEVIRDIVIEVVRSTLLTAKLANGMKTLCLHRTNGRSTNSRFAAKADVCSRSRLSSSRGRSSA